MIDNDTGDQRSPQRRMIELQIEHADLDALIDQSTQAGTQLDELRLRRLKKRRLALRDEMARLKWLIDPKEPA
jgi:hypothetical protein